MILHSNPAASTAIIVAHTHPDVRVVCKCTDINAETVGQRSDILVDFGSLLRFPAVRVLSSFVQTLQAPRDKQNGGENNITTLPQVIWTVSQM